MSGLKTKIKKLLYQLQNNTEGRAGVVGVWGGKDETRLASGLVIIEAAWRVYRAPLHYSTLYICEISYNKK